MNPINQGYIPPNMDTNTVNKQIYSPTVNPAGMNYGYSPYNCSYPASFPAQPPIQPILANPPTAGVGAVNIQIYNPTVNPGGNTNYGNPPCYYMQPPIQQSAQLPVQQPAEQPKQTVQPVQAAAPVLPPTPAAPIPVADTKKAEKPKDKKSIVPLTDNYLITLENYLNNENAEIRYMGAKELFARFKEEKSRSNDPALTALLNKSLQDPSLKVRMLSLAALDVRYAEGNDETVEILKKLQKTDSNYNQDALLASQVLLKMAGKKIDITTENVNPPPQENSQTGQRLDLIAS